MQNLPLAALAFLATSSLAAGDRLTQFATIDGLLAGVFEGHFTNEEVLAAGDFGLGTFEAVDGEMVVVDGIVYQVRADGTVATPGPEATTPFAAVVEFDAEESFEVGKIPDLATFEAALKAKLPNLNIPYAVRVKGTFSHIRTRAPRKQDEPYPTLAEAVEDQVVFEREDIAGELIGFYLPPYVAGINVPGLHLHFLNNERDFGGHVLELALAGGTLRIDASHRWELRLPADSEAFEDADLGIDRSSELEVIESGRE